MNLRASDSKLDFVFLKSIAYDMKPKLFLKTMASETKLNLGFQKVLL